MSLCPAPSKFQPWTFWENSGAKIKLIYYMYVRVCYCYWSRDILPGNVRLIFGMSMVIIQTLITNFTLLCHLYVEGCDHQMWRMTGFQLLWIVTGASCMWGQETHTLSGTPDFTYFGEFMTSHIHYILYILHRMCQSWDYVYGLMTLVCLPGLVWLLCLRTYFIHELVRKFALAT